ncbi:MAG TPA: ferrochelatase [Frankiaceae bacterium]|nr:ferrochelatase [Frankiaceae bacterium]
MAGYDAVLLVSFGGPEGPGDVLPFLRNVTAGRDVPAARLAAVAEHYSAFGGVSPINAQNRALVSALAVELAPRRVYWGNRNWAPYLPETLAQMRADGARRVAVFVTSAYASYSSCRQYREDLAAAHPGRLALDKLRHYYNHPLFIAAQAEQVLELGDRLRDDATLLFTAHSIPLASARTSGPAGGAYPAQLGEAARLVADRVRESSGWRGGFEVAWQSRSGPPSVPWLEPDVNDRLESLAAEGIRDVVAVPVGFVSDHVEVRYDLDTEAAATAERMGIRFARAGTVAASRSFVHMVRELVEEREGGLARVALGSGGPSHDVCPVTCCPGRILRPAAAGEPQDSQTANSTRGLQAAG